MDGATMSAGGGGYEIASGYVTVGVDLEPARQEIAQFKGELANLFQGGMTIGAGMGSYGAGGTQFSAPAGGMSAVGNTIGIGGGMSAQKIEIDTSQAQQSVQQLTGSVKELKDQLSLLETAAAGFTSRGAAVPSNIATEIAGLRSQLGGGVRAPSGGQMSAPAGIAGNTIDNGWTFGMGVAGFSGYDMASAPPVIPKRPYHMRSQRLMAEMYGAAPAMMGLAAPAEHFELPETLSEADEVAEPLSMADVVAETRSPGGRGGGRRGFDASYINPFSIRGLGRAIGNVGAAWGAMEAIRIGGALGTAYAAEPYLAYQHLAAQEQLGAPYSAMASPAAGLRAEAYGQLQAVNEFQGALASTPFIGPLLQALDYEAPARQAQMAQIGRQDAIDAYLPGRANAMASARARMMNDPIGAAQLEGQAGIMAARNDLRRTYLDFGYGSPEASDARSLLHTANDLSVAGLENAHVGLAASFQMAEARFDMADPILTLAGRDFGSVFRALDQRQAAASRQFSAQMMQPAANLSRAISDLDFDAIGGAMSAIAGIGADFRNERADITSQRMGGLYQAESIARSAGAAMQSTVLSARRDTFGAQMAQFEAQAENLKLAATPYGIDVGGAIDIERRALQSQHQFGLQVEGEGLTARSAAAQAEMGLEPLNAQAMTDVARARHEIAMAPPELRAQTQSTVAAELRAHQQLLTAQRGGEVAIDMSLAQAAGTPTAMGVDLTGRLRDTLAAGKTYENGIGNLGSSPDASKTVNVSDKEVSDALKQLVTLFQKLKPTSVTMFQN